MVQSSSETSVISTRISARRHYSQFKPVHGIEIGLCKTYLILKM